MKGYWNLPQETAKAIRNGWYFTGDLAYKDEEGYYYMVDRAKDMIITGGENVYSVEVENVLYQHPSILECAVIGVPDEKWGEAVKAIVVRKQGYQVTEEEILSFVRKKLANYKVPKTIDFVPELPKSGAGKILKRELREQYWVKSERRVN
jgi:long-chain acyl-CoA synthetase